MPPPKDLCWLDGMQVVCLRVFMSMGSVTSRRHFFFILVLLAFGSDSLLAPTSKIVPQPCVEGGDTHDRPVLGWTLQSQTL